MSLKGSTALVSASLVACALSVMPVCADEWSTTHLGFGAFVTDARFDAGDLKLRFECSNVRASLSITKEIFPSEILMEGDVLLKTGSGEAFPVINMDWDNVGDELRLIIEGETAVSLATALATVSNPSVTFSSSTAGASSTVLSTGEYFAKTLAASVTGCGMIPTNNGKNAGWQSQITDDGIQSITSPYNGSGGLVFYCDKRDQTGAIFLQFPALGAPVSTSGKATVTLSSEGTETHNAAHLHEGLLVVLRDNPFLPLQLLARSAKTTKVQFVDGAAPAVDLFTIDPAGSAAAIDDILHDCALLPQGTSILDLKAS